MALNVITATFAEGETVTRTSSLTQYDYGQMLQFEGIELPEAYQVYFSNNFNSDGDAKMQIGNADGVAIPDEYLQTGEAVYAYVFLHEGESDGETKYSVIIPVNERPVANPEEPTPVQQDVIDQAIATLNHAVESTSADVERVKEYGDISESWAVGGTGTRQGEDTDNSKYYSEQASASASTSATKAGEASASAESASGSATTASTMARTATDKAQEASSSASTASIKAQEASASAQSAHDSAVEAASYKPQLTNNIIVF